ncbi:MAG: GntG family PLP-dependent aldolase [Bdellovibrionota bacterium]
MRLIDLRSDTVTRPTAAMLEAMMGASVGDDVYGDDPTVNAFEEKLAHYLGKDAAVLMPSGTMANQVAIKVHCRHGDAIICEENAHCYLYEGGAAAALAGVQFNFISMSAGLSDAAIVSHYVSSEQIHSSPTTLMVLENTHNFNGGHALNTREITCVLAQARKLGLKTHCDGARLWHAAIVFGESERALLADFDSASVCFSKGLGAPVGSALVGNLEFIRSARRYRKQYGGAMRQIGYFAAAMDYALEHHRARLAEDHANANALVDYFYGCSRVNVKVGQPVTNIVYVKFEDYKPSFVVDWLLQHNILVNQLGDGWIRLVTHLDVNKDDIQKVIEVFSLLPLESVNL